MAKENGFQKKILEQNVNARILEIIGSGILLEEKGLNNLHEQICKEFPQNRPDKRRFKNRIQCLIWRNKPIDSALQDIIRNRQNPLKLKSIYDFIPDDFILKRADWHKGLIRSKAKKIIGRDLPGIGRIDLGNDVQNFKIPQTTFKKPLVVKTKNSNNWPVMILNGTNLGIKYGPDIVGNVARKALSDAEARRDEAVILTNFLCFDLKKAGGPAKTARAQILGDNINPELIRNKNYREIVESIIRENPINRVAYRTSEELVNDVLGGWTKICTRPNHRPEYSGKIYITIGLNELALIFAVTYWEIRWWTLKEQKRLDAEKKLVKKALGQAEKELSKNELNTELYKKVTLLNEQLESLRYQRNLTTISTVANQESQRFFAHAYKIVIKKIEVSIPNSKVIGEGTNYLKINDKILKIHTPSHLRVTDGLLNDYASTYAPDVLREENPDVVVICHPWALQYRATGREIDHDGKRDSMNVFVAPIAIDEKYLRSEIGALRIKDHPIVKAVYTQTFKAGVLRLRCSNGIIGADEIPVGALESFKNYPKHRVNKKTKGSSIYKRGPNNIWFMCCSDQHWGGRSKEFVWDKKKGIRLSMAEAVFEMMRREGLCKGNNMPVHFFASPDDPTQGQNHKYRTEPHPHQMSYRLIEKITGHLLAKAQSSKDIKTILQTTEEIRKLSLYQFEKRGSDYVFDQMMQMMQRHIEPNIDIFSAILRKAQKANLIIKGVGNFALEEYGKHDSRNIGIINMGTGDRHFSKTLDFELIEGPFYAQRLRDLLCQLDEWKNKKELVERLVVSPIYGQTCIGWGTISVANKHEYGIEVRSAPTNMAGWGDPLRGHVKRDLQRGNYSRIWNKKLPVLKFFGDKHFFSGISTGHAIYHMSPASVHTDAYGERGFAPNNTGVSFLGVPADGPDSGPIFWRVLPFDVIKDFVEDNPRSFDWEEFLPNPA
ncbi:hypothetical protein KKA27_00030 [Patescibacteria group bacterium]|nr:hypothetical protein [Patescibacteria group bacterium]MBU2632999.1 hypothetical protein [Patescibacteria group bacterium]